MPSKVLSSNYYIFFPNYYINYCPTSFNFRLLTRRVVADESRLYCWSTPLPAVGWEINYEIAQTFIVASKCLNELDKLEYYCILNGMRCSVACVNQVGTTMVDTAANQSATVHEPIHPYCATTNYSVKLRDPFSVREAVTFT